MNSATLLSIFEKHRSVLPPLPAVEAFVYRVMADILLSDAPVIAPLPSTLPVKTSEAILKKRIKDNRYNTRAEWLAKYGKKLPLEWSIFCDESSTTREFCSCPTTRHSSLTCTMGRTRPERLLYYLGKKGIDPSVATQ